MQRPSSPVSHKLRLIQNSSFDKSKSSNKNYRHFQLEKLKLTTAPKCKIEFRRRSETVTKFEAPGDSQEFLFNEFSVTKFPNFAEKFKCLMLQKQYNSAKYKNVGKCHHRKPSGSCLIQ